MHTLTDVIGAKTPLKVWKESYQKGYKIKDANNLTVAHASENVDAGFIVRAVNAHEELIAVLKEAKNLVDNYSDSMESFDSGELEKAIFWAEEKLR